MALDVSEKYQSQVYRLLEHLKLAQCDKCFEQIASDSYTLTRQISPCYPRALNTYQVSVYQTALYLYVGTRFFND